MAYGDVLKNKNVNGTTEDEQAKLMEIMKKGSSLEDEIPIIDEVLIQDVQENDEETNDVATETPKETEKIERRGRKPSKLKEPARLAIKIDKSMLEKVKNIAKKERKKMAILVSELINEVSNYKDVSEIPSNPYEFDDLKTKASSTHLVELADREKYADWCYNNGVSQSVALEAMLEKYRIEKTKK